MEMNMAKTILAENGIMVDQTVVHKNGRELDTLTIGEGKVKPTLYQDTIVNLHNEEEMMGFEAPDISGTDQLMYVASTTNHVQGAAVMLLDDMLEDFCREHGIESVFIIPSSFHEVLLVVGDAGKSEINAMISEVNETTLSEMERLSDHVYEFFA